MQKKLLITVGGTGGHIFPALTLAKQIKNAELLFVGGGLSRNRYFEKEKFPFKDVSCGTLPLTKPHIALRNLFRICKGIASSRQIIREFSPDLVVGFGSYHTLPLLLAAKIQKVPIILHEANRLPGKVNRLLAPYVNLIGVHFPDTKNSLRGNVEEIPIPLREGFKYGSVTKSAALNHYNLLPNRTTLLIFGGSQGAHAVNFLVADALSGLKKTIQVLHFTGDMESAKKIRDQYAENGILACVKEFETRMDLAWQAADCVISRSGAVTLSEELEFEVPGILIPFPYATDNHQESNADFMVHTVKGAIKRLEKDLNADLLRKDISQLLEDDGAQLKTMQQSMRQYKIEARPRDLCTVVTEFLTRNV